MSRVRVWLKPFADDTGSAYATSWLEVSDDVVSLGGLQQSLDMTEYDLGIFRANAMKVSLRNNHGKYSDVPAVESVFKYKRGESLMKLTWEPGDHDLVPGFFIAGNPDAIVTEPLTVFEGVVNDDASTVAVDDIRANFQLLGYESLLQNLIVPYSSISNGDSLSTVLYQCLNQAPFNQRVTVSLVNIVAGTSVTIDDKTKLENKTVIEALKLLLLPANSVLYIRNGVVYVAGRTAGASLAYTFYGAGSSNGMDNILSIADFRNGRNRVLNFATWKDTSLYAQDATSVIKYGTQKKEISFDPITDNTKRTTIITAIKDEFKLPKRELSLETWIDPDRLNLFLLDQIALDYLPPIVPTENLQTAIFERDYYESKYYAEELYQFTIEATARFKVIGRNVSFVDETITLILREI
jgi:hypothetical protein